MTAIIKKVKVYEDCKTSNNSLQISKWNVWPRLYDSNIVCLMHLIYKWSWIYIKLRKIYKTEDESPYDSSREMFCLFILLHACLHIRYFVFYTTSLSPYFIKVVLWGKSLIVIVSYFNHLSCDWLDCIGFRDPRFSDMKKKKLLSRCIIL